MREHWRRFSPCAWPWGLRADSALDVHALFEKAAAAMADRKAAAFAEAFDPAMPGFGRLRSQVEALLKTNDAESTIEWRKNEGDDQNRTVQLNWRLEITERNGAAAVTHRQAEVACKLAKKSGKWRIVSFTPQDFFAPPQAEQAWQVVMTAAQGLTEAATDTSANSGDVPAANTNKFMQAFDPALPGYAQLKDNVLALEQAADIESSVDLVQNDGDDRGAHDCGGLVDEPGGARHQRGRGATQRDTDLPPGKARQKLADYEPGAAVVLRGAGGREVAALLRVDFADDGVRGVGLARRGFERRAGCRAPVA